MTPRGPHDDPKRTPGAPDARLRAPPRARSSAHLLLRLASPSSPAASAPMPGRGDARPHAFCQVIIIIIICLSLLLLLLLAL